MKSRLCLILSILVFSAHCMAAEYIIDSRSAHAAINFKFKHIGISWLTGRFRTFSGRFSFDENNIAGSNISVTIDPASLDSNHAERDKHIRSDDYLDVEKYPDARFVSTRVVDRGDGRASIHGNLTLHGVTREITIDAAITGKGKDPWGGYRAGFEGKVTLNTRDFGFSMPPTNTVHMELYLEGVRQ